ncbi:MAG: biopolymer transporter ExbD [Phycisphaerae bacterium]|nr:MAG: biopolymer transporter ExbD [Phycisphaerae bacterium]
MRLRTFHPHQPAGKVNVTPLIDVVMVLIIFYLIVGNLARAPLPKVALPSSGTGVAEEDTAVILNVLPAPGGPRVVIDGIEVAVEDLPALLKARLHDPASASVLLRADRSLAFGEVSPIVEACREAGLTSVKLVARRGGTP